MTPNLELLKELEIEDIIWVINFFIVLFAMISNEFEKDYILTNNSKSKEIFKNINLILLTIIFFTNLYFVYLRYKNYKKLKNTSPEKDVFITDLNLLASILVLISAGIFIYTELVGRTPEEEMIQLF